MGVNGASALREGSWGRAGGVRLSTQLASLIAVPVHSDSAFAGDVRLDNVMEWFGVTSTGLTLVDLFNLQP